jgi:adenylate cyclase
LLGLLGALAVLVIHLTGLDHRAELYALDLRFRYFSRAEPSDEIVHVDIDDRSLEELGRWPWPRERVAGIIEVLAECGARAIVLDLIMPDAQKTGYVSEADTIYDRPAGEVISEARALPVFDDVLLAEAIAHGPDVAVPMHVDFAPPAPSALERRTKELLSKKPQASLAAVLSNVPARELVASREKIEKAYLRERAIAAMRDFGIPAKQAEAPWIRSAKLIPPLVTFAEAARHSGFVTFVPDEDGVARRIPLLARAGDRIYPQFGLALAAARLSRDHGGGTLAETLIPAGRGVLLRFPDGFERKVPVDEDGMMLITWTKGGTGGRHVSCALVGSIHEQRRRIGRNKRLARLAQRDLGKALGQDELLELFKSADDLYEKRVKAERQRYDAQLFDPPNVPPETAALKLKEDEIQIEADIDKEAATFREALNNFYLKRVPKDPKEKAKYDRCVFLRDLWDQAVAANERKRLDIERLRLRLEPQVKNKICIIGTTATGAGDFVPTPLKPRTPGIVVHSNIINTIISGDFITRFHWALEVLVIITAAAVVSLLAAAWPVVPAGLISALLVCGYAAFNGAVVFGLWGVWLPAAAPLGAMFAAFLLVTAFRQLTEERAKRRIRDMFAHALSPTLVDRLLEDPSLAQLGGQKRMLSCMFSDIVGFTLLSERLGPQKTVRLLNRYFDRVTDVVQNRGGGYLNKFLGDGVFCFFGAPVLQDDHAARAIKAAVECRREVAELDAAVKEELGEDVRLSVRIGISTGEAMVGNCGSTDRMDYTAVGDCVNLAARLEASNKFFGTGILVSQESWREGGGGLLARPLGKLLVAGQRSAIEVWNVLGRREDATPKLIEACQEFRRAIDLFRRKRYAEAAKLFEKVASAMPDDGPAGIFGRLAREFAAAAPAEGWRPKSPFGDGVVRILLPWDSTAG